MAMGMEMGMGMGMGMVNKVIDCTCMTLPKEPLPTRHMSSKSSTLICVVVGSSKSCPAAPFGVFEDMRLRAGSSIRDNVVEAVYEGSEDCRLLLLDHGRPICMGMGMGMGMVR